VLPGIVEDLRTTVVAGKVLAVWRKRRALHERFANVGLPAHALHPESVLTASEREQAAALACNMGLDMCEMDIIRDRVDGRIYVIDVNQTPYSPPGTAHGLAGLRVMHRVAAEFEREWGTLLGRSEA